MRIRFQAVFNDGALSPIGSVDLSEGQVVQCESVGDADKESELDVLELADHLTNEYIGYLLHELYRPLTSARNSIAMASRDMDKHGIAPRRPYLAEAMEDTDAAVRMTETLSISKRSRREHLMLEQDVIAPAIRSVMSKMHERSLSPQHIDHRGLRDIPPLRADRRGLIQLVVTYLLRAIDAAPDPSAFRFQIIGERHHDHFDIKLRDWGDGTRGIERPDSDQDEELVRDPKLSLLFARRIARAHGGEFRLSHNPNPTEFTLTLPNAVIDGSHQHE